MEVGGIASYLPVRDSSVPVGSLRCQRPALEVLERDLVRRDHAGPRASLDRHVGDRAPPLDTEALDRRSAELDDGSRSTGRSNLSNLCDKGCQRERGEQGRRKTTCNVEDDVLGSDTLAEGTVNLDTHVEGPRLEECLGGEDVLDLGRSYSKRERSCRQENPASAPSLHPQPRRAQDEPKAPWVLVWESPQTMVAPGSVKPCSGPITYETSKGDQSPTHPIELK